MKRRRYIPLGILITLIIGLLGSRPVSAQASLFVVNANYDGSDAHDVNLGDCTCADTNGWCTLRAAIEEANACAGTDVIAFQSAMVIDVDAGVGSLPPIDETVSIDASSVWDIVNDEPGVMINGGGMSGDGLFVRNANSCQIYGLYITDFGGRGVYVKSASNQIGGTGAGQRNVLSGNGTGVSLYGAAASSNIVSNNYIGLTPAGDAKDPNTTGLSVQGGAINNVIGGDDGASANFISGNTTLGVIIGQMGTDNNRVSNNVIGLASDLSPLGNGTYGVRVSDGPLSTRIGGGSGWGNIISGNSNAGIYIYTAGAGTEISHNLLTANDAEGLFILDTSDSYIMSNVISSNALDGVWITGASAVYNLIWENSIFGNGAKGIRLDNGANMSISAPFIDHASTLGGASGSVACAGCTVAIFSDNDDEGRIYHGTTSTDGLGNWTYSGTLTGPNITATVIDAAYNTSEFSVPYVLFNYRMYLPLVQR